MSEDDEPTGDEYRSYAEPTGPFQPAIHDGIPVAMRGSHRETRYGRLGRNPHPPLTCPAPRHTATLRGFYRCPACSEKVPLAGQVSVAEIGQELGERWAEAVAGGVVQVFWIAVESAAAALRGVLWVWYWLWARRTARENDGGVAPEMVRALVVMGMVAARYRPPGAVSEAKECQSCDL